MPADPTPQEQEQARKQFDVLDRQRCPHFGDTRRDECGTCVTTAIATALAEQRYRDAEAVEAAGDKHAGLIGKDVPQRMAHIAALYLRSGYDADAIRREDA